MRLTLTILTGQVGGVQRGLQHTFGREGGIIGRNAACDWRIEDASRTLSGRHATITFRDGHFYVTDTSTNGVYVNDSFEPLGRGRSAEISEGTRLRFGDYVVSAALSEDGLGAEARPSPRMSISATAPGRGLSTDPLDMLGDDFGSGELSMKAERPSSRSSAAPTPRVQTDAGRPRDDTLGSFFGAAPQPRRKDDPFANLGTGATATRRSDPDATDTIGPDWMERDSGSSTSDAKTVVAPEPEVPPQRMPEPQPQPARAVPQTRAPAAPDLGSRLSDALASELDDPAPGTVRRSVRQGPRAATETDPEQEPAGSPEPGTGAAPQQSALPHDLSWEDLLGGGAPAPAGPVGGVASAAPSAAPAAQPLPPMDDLLGSASAAAAGSAERGAPEPTPVAEAPAARRTRRAPGNNLLSDLVTPSTRSGGAGTPAGNPLDPVSVLRERASHRPAMTQYAAEPAPAAAPAQPASAPAGTASVDAVLRAAGLDPEAVPEGARETVACEIARTARAAAAGMTDVLAARRLFKEEFRLDRTRVQPERNNPFKFHASGDEALSKAATGDEAGFLPPSEAMADGFTELKAHELAAVAALQNAIATVLAKLDPATIQAEDAAGGFFGRGDGKALWERYKELHAGLAQDPEATARTIVSEQFLRTYEKTMATLRAKDPSQ